jgi:hypothetical protein
MLKRLIIVTTLGLACLVPVLSAQAPDAGQGPKPRLRAAGRLLRKQLRRGVRLGKIAPADRDALRGKVQDLRAKFQALRQNGQRLTAAQRQEFRQGLMTLRQDFLAAHK